jgi:hypothetical protein
MGRSGSVAGNTFAQSLAVAAQAAVKSVELISGQAGKAGGDALKQGVTAGAKAAAQEAGTALKTYVLSGLLDDTPTDNDTATAPTSNALVDGLALKAAIIPSDSKLSTMVEIA